LSPEECAQAADLRATVAEGIASGTGRPYNDAYRVATKLFDKRGQLAPADPSVICLGIADPDPHGPPVEWAVQGVFTGNGKVLEILADQIQRGFQDKGKEPGTVARAEAEAFLVRVEAFRGSFAAEPRLTAVAIYRWTGAEFSPSRLYRNPAAGPAHTLTDTEWAALSTALGF
jgi:hypothetical protein